MSLRGVYWQVWPSDSELPIETLLSDMRESGVSPIRAAAAMDIALNIRKLGDAEKARWIRSLYPLAWDPAISDLLGSWSVKLREHRFYTSFGP